MKRNKMTGVIWLAIFAAVIGLGLLGVTLKAGISPEKPTEVNYRR